MSRLPFAGLNKSKIGLIPFSLAPNSIPNRVRSPPTESTESSSVGRATPRSTCCSPRAFLKLAADAQFTGTFAELLNPASLHSVRLSDNRETAGGLASSLSFHDRDDQGQECD